MILLIIQLLILSSIPSMILIMNLIMRVKKFLSKVKNIGKLAVENSQDYYIRNAIY